MALSYPNLRPDLVTVPAFHIGGLNLGPFPIRWYALAYIAGILLGWRYAVALIRKAKLWGPAGPPVTPIDLDDLILWLTLGVIVGGRLGYVVFYMLTVPQQRVDLAADPLEVFRLWHGGMSFHGGALGVIVALAVFARVRRFDLLRVADIVAACTPIGLFFGRLANFINGELWGRVTSLPWGMVFCTPRLAAAAAGGACPAGWQPRHPSQLYEAALEGLLLFLILRVATHGLGWLRRQGVVAGLFLVGYGLARISLENVRMPDEGLRNLPLGLTVGMLLSAPMVAAGAWLLWRGLKTPVSLPPAPAAP